MADEAKTGDIAAVKVKERVREDDRVIRWSTQFECTKCQGMTTGRKA